ncbi:MAG: Stp1/IreP family PP2C-type Ser/Thr phosphatase [Candidatus Zixiibacteriota bacterium]|nr:MAG: Stp1/IreP family PP2C-type Ser/Thr phosphatase [candidate division Zixibacteria bacterium]
MDIKITGAGKTDIGHVRSVNEDCLRIDDEHSLFIVCDGMGGHQAGEVASREACEVICHCFSTLAEEIAGDSTLAIPAAFPTLGDLLVKGIRIANRSIYIKSRSRSDYSGMGTTVVAAALQDDLINIAHVGDSRAYLMTADRLVPLTTDHSWISELEQSGQYSKEEAAQLVNKNVITRALGIHETVEIDYRARRIAAGDIYIMCTDGLCGYVDDGDIFSVAGECGGDVNVIVDNLIQLANDRGGTDNVTVLALRIDRAEGGPESPVIDPVTVSKEGDEALLRENQIVESFTRLREQTQKIGTIPEPKMKSHMPAVIFVIITIVIIALLAYYIFLK